LSFYKKDMKRFIRFMAVVTALWILPALTLGENQYLLMQPIGDAVTTGHLKGFKDICLEKISVNFESPFNLTGFIYTAKFVEDFTVIYSQYEVSRLEWASKQIENEFAVQSLNLILKNKRSEKTVYYKLIFFMTKTNKDWKIYYFRGLKI